MKTLILLQILFFTGSSLYAQQGQAQQLKLDQIMSKADQKKTGVSKLTATERNELEKWMTQFAIDAMKLAQGQGQAGAAKPPGVYRGGAKGHWIKKVIERGSMVQLEDGSIWQISPLSKVDAILWLVTEQIVVTSSENPLYPYKLINTDGQSSAEVKLISQ